MRAGTNPSVNIIDSALWQKHLNAKLPPAKQQALERIVVAGMKVMFDKQTHKMMLTELDAPGDMVTKLAEATTKLMILLFKHSNGSMPGDLLIPAGGVLMAKACEFLNQTGETVTEDQFRQALTAMSKLVMKAASSPGDQAAPPASPASPAPAPAAPANPLNQGA
jgi:hypothetical protein